MAQSSQVYSPNPSIISDDPRTGGITGNQPWGGSQDQGGSNLPGELKGGLNAGTGIMKMMNQSGAPMPSWASAGSTLGTKILPGVGAGLGIWDMISHGDSRGKLANALSGAGTGASIGTMFMPGLGTGIGAGVGALAGLLRNAFGVSQQERGGRSQRDQFAGNVAQWATPEEKAQAQAEVAKGGPWKNATDPLNIIVMRNHMIQSGMDPAQADQQAQGYMHSMWNAEKGGQGAVQAAAKPYAQYFKS